LFFIIGSVLVIPMLFEPLIRRLMTGAPEFEQSLTEHQKKIPEEE
jgi:hypothetical protein